MQKRNYFYSAANMWMLLESHSGVIVHADVCVQCVIPSPAVNSNRYSIVQLYAKARRFVVSSSRGQSFELLVAALVSSLPHKCPP
jgi:hypothetical protein